MKKHELVERTNSAVEQTSAALQTVYDNLNPGQKKQLLKLEEVKTLFDRYAVKY